MASKIASGNIVGCRFVKLDTTTSGNVSQAGAGDQIYGIAHAGTRNPPLSGLQDGFLAVAGEIVGIYTSTDAPIVPTGPVLLQLSGTVTIGDRLKSDTGGTGVTTTNANDEIGAIAEQSGVSGDVIAVRLISPVKL